MRSLLTLSLAIAALGATPAMAQQLFDFDGQAHDAPAVGATLGMVSVVVNADALTMPLPLDLANFQYTIVVTGLQLDTAGTTDLFSNGTIALYEDAATAADFANEGTFTDGTAVLVGDLVSFSRTMFTSTLGSGTGVVNWTGGSRIDDLHPSDRDNWSFLVSVSRSPSLLEPGFDERWDGKVEPREPVVDREVQSVGEIKSGY